jgi:hypothetical protein
MNEIKLSSSVLLRGLNFPCWKAFYSQFTKIYLTVFICLSIPIYLSIYLSCSAKWTFQILMLCCLFLSRQQKRKTDLWGGTGNEAGPSAGALSRLSFVLFVCLFCLFVCLFCLFCLFALNLFFLLLIFQFLIVSYKSLLSSYYLCFHSVGVFILHLIS